MTMTTTTMSTNKMNELLSPNAKSTGRLNPRRRKISVEIKPLKDRIKNLKDATSKTTAEKNLSDGDPTNSPTQMLSPSHKQLSINPTPLKDLIENYKAQASPVKKSKAMISPTTPKSASRRLTKTQIDQMMVMVDEGEVEDDGQEEGEGETEKEKSWEQYALTEENKTLHEKLDALEKRLYDSEKYGHEEHTKAKIRLEELHRVKKERDQAYRELQTHHHHHHQHHKQESGQETSSGAAHRSEVDGGEEEDGEEFAATKEDLMFENNMLHEKLDALEKRLYEAEGMYHTERKSAKIQREELKRLKKERDHVIREQKQQLKQQFGEEEEDPQEDELVAENLFLNEKLDALEERLYEAEEKYHKEHKTSQVQQEELQRLKRERDQLFREQKKQQQIVANDGNDDDDDDDTTGQQKHQPSTTQENADDLAAENQFLNEKLDALEARLYEAEDMYQSEQSKYEVQCQELQNVKKERDELLLHSSRDKQPQQLQQNSDSTSTKDDDYCPTESIRYLMETHVLPLFESFAVNNNNDIIQVPNPSDTRKDIENLSQALQDCCSYYHSSPSSSQKSKGGGNDNTNENPWISTTVKSFQAINRQHYKNLQLLMESKLESSSEKEESSEETESSSSVLKQQQQQLEATISDQQLEIQQLKCELDIIKDKNKDAETALAMNRYTIQTLKKNESQLEEETDAAISKLEKENNKLKDALILLKQKFDEQKTAATMTTTDNDGNNNTEKDIQIKKLSEEKAVLEQSFEEEVQALMEANQKLKESKATSQYKLEKQIDDLNRANQENKTKIQHWKDKYKTDTRKLMKMIEKSGSTKK